MKYLEKSFTVAASSSHRSFFAEVLDEVLDDMRRKHAKEPHEYEGGTICQLCGLDSKAKIHKRPRSSVRRASRS